MWYHGARGDMWLIVDHTVSSVAKQCYDGINLIILLM